MFIKIKMFYFFVDEVFYLFICELFAGVQLVTITYYFDEWIAFITKEQMFSSPSNIQYIVLAVMYTSWVFLGGKAEGT